MEYDTPNPLGHILEALDKTNAVYHDLLSELWDDYDQAKKNREMVFLLEDSINHLCEAHWALCSFTPYVIEEATFPGTPEGKVVVFLPKELEFDSVWSAWVPKQDDDWLLALTHVDPKGKVTNYTLNIPIESDNISSDFRNYIEPARSYEELLMTTRASKLEYEIR